MVSHFAVGHEDVSVLVLEGIPGHFFHVPVQVQDAQLSLGAGFSGHLVMVGFQLRAGLGQGVDHPELLHRAHVPADEGEVLPVGGPVPPGEAAGGGIGLHVSGIVVGQPGVVAAAARGELFFHQGAVLGVFGGLLEVLPVHHPQVVVLDIKADISVRAHIGPGGVLVLVLVRVIGEHSGGDVIVETIFYELAGSVSGAVPLFRLGLEVPLEVLVVLELQAQGQVLGVVRVAGDVRNLPSQFLQVKELFLAARGGVHHVVAGAIGRFPAIPEFVRIPEPVGTDLGGINHVAQTLGREARGLLVIGRLGRCRG